jgi:hypothetical protein
VLPLSSVDHLLVADTQVKPGVPLNHLCWLSQYALDEGPGKIIIIGDWWDLPSLSIYDERGSKAAEGRRMHEDLDAGRYALDLLLGPWERAGWAPEIHFCMGNHEKRWHKAVNKHPHLLDGGGEPWGLEERGIKVHKFLQHVDLDGVRYSHFFPHDAKGRVRQTKNGAPSACAQALRQTCSATAGHQQGLDISVVPSSGGMRRGLICGSFYLHDEEYMDGLDDYWRGTVHKRNVRDGNYDLQELSVAMLANKYRRLEPKVRLTA